MDTPDSGSFIDTMTPSPSDRELKARLQAGERQRQSTLLLGAISNNDADMFAAALKNNADVNYDGGKPLQRAMENKNFLFLRQLVTHGADIAHAVAALEDEQSGITRKARYDDYYNRTTYTYKNKDEEKRYKQISSTVKALKEYEQTYLEKIAPVEAVQLQQKTLDELRELKSEIMEALHGKAVDKPRLALPKAAARGR